MRHAIKLEAARFITLQRRFRTRLRPARGPMDVVPLVSVTLLLLLFFMVHSPFVLQPGILLDLPESPFTAGARYEALVVTVSQEGLIFFNDERTPLEGLASAFAQAAHEKPQRPLLIEADSRVRHGTLVQIYNMAATVGIREIVLATRLPPTHWEGGQIRRPTAPEHSP